MTSDRLSVFSKLCLLLPVLWSTSTFGAIQPVERLSRLYMFSEDCSLSDGPNCGNTLEEELIFEGIDPTDNRFNDSLNGASGSGVASQDSMFTPVVVDVMTSADAPQLLQEFSSRVATSSFNFVFDLQQAVPFSLIGNVAVEDLGVQDPVARVSLNGPGTALEFSGVEVFDLSGTLEAGQYTFQVESSATSSVIESSSATANAMLIVPLPPAFYLLACGLVWLAGLARRSFRDSPRFG